MSPEAALIELFARVGAAHGGTVLVNDEELTEWPSGAVAAMKSQKLLTKARLASSAVCPGCERACVMPVQTLPRSSGPSDSFIVCDKRSDINRVPLSAARLSQWRCDAEAVCGFIATSLDLRRGSQHTADSELLPIGIARGGKRSQMLCLRANSDLGLTASGNVVPVGELIMYRDGKYSVDGELIRQLVDSASTADPRYTPSTARREARKLDTEAMYENWRRAYRDLRKQRPAMSDVWYSHQISKQDIAASRSADTIRKHMKA